MKFAIEASWRAATSMWYIELELKFISNIKRIKEREESIMKLNWKRATIEAWQELKEFQLSWRKPILYWMMYKIIELNLKLIHKFFFMYFLRFQFILELTFN